MKKSRNRTAFVLASALIFSMAGCQGKTDAVRTSSSKNDTAQETISQKAEIEKSVVETGQIHKIGVVVYNLEDDEVNMFRSYYEDYLSAAFSVNFVYSDTVTTIDEEKQFADQAKEAGCEGIISYVSYDLPEITRYCADDMYYVLASGNYTQDQLAQAEQHEKFLGITGPSAEDEYDAGVDLVESMQKEGEDALSNTEKTWILLNGGVRTGNYMHQERFAGALDALQKAGYTLTASADELGMAAENCLAAEHPDGGKVYLCPGYYYSEDSRKNILEALDSVDPDAVISVCSLAVLYDTLQEKEIAQGKDIQIGTVDCFSETNRSAFERQDAFGNSSIDCVVGKCQAMGAPAFIAMYNAVTGHADVVRNEGKPYRLNQNMWTARSAAEYDTLSVKASNIYENVYTTDEMMKVLAVYNPAADYTAFENFVEKL